MIVCFYLEVTIGVWAMAKVGTSRLIFVLTMADIVAMILLFSGVVSAAAIAIFFRKGLDFFLLQKHVFALALSAHRSSLVSQWVHLLASLISSSVLSLICMSATQADLNHTQ